MIGIELEDMPIPKWTAMSILVIGFAMLIVRFLQLGWKVLTNQAEGFGMTDEAEDSMEIAKELKAMEEQEKLEKDRKDSDKEDRS